MRILKYEGSGNDFLLINNFDLFLDNFLNKKGLTREDFVKKVCAYHTGIGTDGLIIIEPPQNKENAFKWDFFNQDGSRAEMCGNGSRCAARFAYEESIVKSQSFKFETLAGIIEASIKEDGKVVKVQLTKPHSLQKDIELSLDGLLCKGDFVNTGVPHFVVIREDIESFNVNDYGRKIRFHEFFNPKGTNVNFIGLKNGKLKVRTYERGVEAETLACGTGAVASSIIAYLNNIVDKTEIEIETSGGEILKVYLDIDKNKNINNVYLEGRVKKVFEGILSEEILGD